MTLTEGQCDALRELGNIGAAHAATVLSQMLNCQVEMTVPEIQLVDVSRIYSFIGDEIAVLIAFQIQGELGNGGYILLHLPEKGALRLVNTLLGQGDGERAMDEMDRSTITEIGNIMVSSFLDATATLLGIVMLPSPPQLALDMPHAVIQTLLTGEGIDIDEIVLFRTELYSQERMISSNLMLLPNPPMLWEILGLLDGLLQPSS